MDMNKIKVLTTKANFPIELSLLNTKPMERAKLLIFHTDNPNYEFDLLQIRLIESGVIPNHILHYYDNKNMNEVTLTNGSVE